MLTDNHLPVTADLIPYIEFDGVRRPLGNLAPAEPHGLPAFSSSYSLMPRSEWVECDWSNFSPCILDQGYTSACSSHASAMGMMYCLNKIKHKVIHLNPFFLYALVNGGRDAGSVLSYNLTALEQYGCCEDSALPHRLTFAYRLPQGAYANANHFRVKQAFHCPTFDDICTAIQQGFVTPFGIYIGQNFIYPDANGVCPLPNGYGGGHAILGVGLKKHPKWGWLIKFQNSWGKNFNRNGFAYVHEGFFNRMNPDAFAIQAIADYLQEKVPVDEEPVIELIDSNPTITVNAAPPEKIKSKKRSKKEQDTN